MTDSGRKKVLILTYYWPPSGGAGVQRWLKFSKYMREFGYEPIVYTADNPEYPSIDESLIKDIPENLTVLKTRVWEPYQLYKWFTHQKKDHRINTGFLNQDRKKGIAEKISIWIRGNFFIPDARKFWIKPSVRYLAQYLAENPVDLIATTGPPHSVHLIGMAVSRRLKIPWIADFRDPWTKIDYYQDLMLTWLADRRHRRLESCVVSNARFVSVNSHDMKRYFNELGVNTVQVIPNGYDPEDFDDPEDNGEKNVVKPDAKFSITHVGTITPSRNSETLWKVLSDLVHSNDGFAGDLELRLIGDCDYSAVKAIEDLNLYNWVHSTRYIPHNEAIGILKRSQVLLLLIRNTPFARGAQPAKLFEYMNAGRPILAVGPPNGEAASFLDETKTGFTVDFNDYDGMKELILNLYESYRKGNLSNEAVNIDRYSRKTQTGAMTEIFRQILQNP